MSLPSAPPQGGSDTNPLAPDLTGASPMEDTKNSTTDSTGASPTEDARTDCTEPIAATVPTAHSGTEGTASIDAPNSTPASDADGPSQDDMAHVYVDYYVTNPTDLPAPAPPATSGEQPTADASATDNYGDDPANGSILGDDPPSDTDANLTPPAPPAPYDDPSLVPSPSAPPATKATHEAANTPEPKAPPEPKAMTLMDHLGELRSRLVRSAIAVGLAFAATYSVADILFRELTRPLLAALPPNSKLIFTALPEAFFVYLQVGFVAAIFLASPYIFYQVWGFIAPGLYDEEKKYAVPMALCSAFFFTLGATFCFLVVFPFSFTFFVGFATDDIVAMPSLSEYLGFALKMLIAFGLIFEMPLFTFFLSRMGLVTAGMMRKVRRYAILIIFIIAAILTPPDVVSQMLMAMPMLLLYELSIFIAVAFGRKSKAEREAESAKDAEKAQDGKDSDNTNEPTSPVSPIRSP